MRHCLSATLILCCCVVWVPLALADGGVTGTVKNTSSVGIEGVKVYILRDDGFHLAVATTDIAGLYTASELPPGDYVASTRNEQGYIDELFDDMPCPGGCNYFTGTRIPVLDGITTPDVDFVLDEGGRLTGTVTTVGGGAPLEGVDVKIYTAVDPVDPYLGGDYITSGTSDTTGVYLSRSGLPTGSYVAMTANEDGYLEEMWDDHACDGACEPADGDAIEVTAGLTVDEVDFELDGGDRISGTIASSQGGAISGARIDVYDSTGALVTSADPAGDGSWITDAGLLAGSYFLLTENWWGFIDELWQDIPCASSCTVTDGTAVAVAAGATTPGIDIILDPGGQISGTITEDGSGQPISDAGVEVYDSDGARIGTAFADGLGVYTAGGLPTGNFYLRAYSWDLYVSELYDDVSCVPECLLEDGDLVAVTAPGIVASIDFSLVNGGRIDGTLSSGGNPVWDAEIQVFDDLGDPVTSALVDALGAFSTEALPAGSYYLVTDNQLGYVDEVWEDIPCAAVCDPEEGTPVALVAGGVAEIDMELDSGGIITGAVTAVDGGDPAADVTIVLYDNVGGFADFSATDELGVYAFGGLPGGSYYVRALSTALLVGEVWPNMSCSHICDPTLGTLIVVPSGGTIEGIDLELESSVLHIDGFESGDTSGWT